MRRRLDASEALSLITEAIDELFRELREVLDCDAAPSVNDSRMRSNFRFLVSIA